MKYLISVAEELRDLCVYRYVAKKLIFVAQVRHLIKTKEVYI